MCFFCAFQSRCYFVEVFVVSVFGILYTIFSEGKEMFCGYEITNFLFISVIVYNDSRLHLSTCTTLTWCIRNFHKLFNYITFAFYVYNLLSDW